MGTDDDHLIASWWERCKPRHEIKMSKAFCIGETTVTLDLWEAVM
jgi:formylglycine-generating enzyme required for sulfatase activity